MVPVEAEELEGLFRLDAEEADRRNVVAGGGANDPLSLVNVELELPMKERGRGFVLGEGGCEGCSKSKAALASVAGVDVRGVTPVCGTGGNDRMMYGVSGKIVDSGRELEGVERADWFLPLSVTTDSLRTSAARVGTPGSSFSAGRMGESSSEG